MELVDGESGELACADSMRRVLGNDPEELGRCNLRGWSGSSAVFLQSRDEAMLVGQRPRGPWKLWILVRWRGGVEVLDPGERGVLVLVGQRWKMEMLQGGRVGTMLVVLRA